MAAVLTGVLLSTFLFTASCGNVERVLESDVRVGAAGEEWYNLENKLNSELDEKLLESTVADFEKLVEDYVKNLEKFYQVPVLWYDMYGEHPHLQENTQYHKYKITVRVESPVFTEVVMNYNYPAYTYTQWYANNNDNKISFVFSKSADVFDFYIWTEDSCVNTGLKFNVTLGVPEVFDKEMSLTSKFPLNLPSKTTKHIKETHSVSQVIDVSPYKNLKAELIIYHLVMTVLWKADVIFEGWIAVWFKEKVDDHWLWFYPVEVLENAEFIKHGASLKTNVTGVFIGSQATETILNLEEYPLNHSEQPTKISTTKKSINPIEPQIIASL